MATDMQQQYSRKYEAANRERRAADKRTRYANSAEARKKTADYNKQYREANLERLKKLKKEWYHKNRERSLVYAKEYNAKNGVKMMLRNAERRAKKYGVPFCLTAADISVPATCPVLGVKLTKGRFAPSLDRIRGELGYVPGNVIVVSHRANQIKSDATWSEILRVGEFYRVLTS